MKFQYLLIASVVATDLTKDSPAQTMYPAVGKLEGIQVVLASKSPRRLHCFKSVGIAVEQRGSSFVEESPNGSSPSEYAMANAKGKNDDITVSKEGAYLKVAAGTIVVKDGVIYMKPGSRQEAVEMLSSFSSNWVDVITGVNLQWIRDGVLIKEIAFHETTRVKLRNLSPAIIDVYLNTSTGMDHTGALALHDEAMILVERYDGDYYNAIGFPMHTFYRKLEEF